MKFGNKLTEKAIPEWIDAYINYNALKKILHLYQNCYQIVKANILNDSISQIQTILTIIKSIDQFFFKYMINQMKIMNQFFIHKSSQLVKKYQDAILVKVKEKKHKQQFLENLKLLYLQLNYLLDFEQMNKDGIRKILKKYRKIKKKLYNLIYGDERKIEWNISIEFKQQNGEFIDIEKQIQQISIMENIQLIKTKIDSVQNLFVFNSLNKSKIARQKIREVISTKLSLLQVFVAGTFFGTSLILVFIIVLSILSNNNFLQDPLVIKIFPIFRGSALLILYYWLLVVNVYGWKKYRINYELIFKLNQHHSSLTNYFRTAAIFTSIYLLIFLWWLFIRQQFTIIGKFQITQNFFKILPSGIWIVLIIYLFLPLKIYQWKSRLYLMILIGKILISPFIKIQFSMIWLTDQLISLINPFRDFQYTICFYSRRMYQLPFDQQNICQNGKRFESGFIIGFIFYMYRIIQNIRNGYDIGKYLFTKNFINSLKYLSSILTLTFSYLYNGQDKSIFYTWIGFAIISTFYSYIWDVIQDFDLFNLNCKHFLLRNRLAYGNTKFYYFIIVFNFICRCAWVFSISPNIIYQIGIQPTFFTLLVSFLQIIRRAMWNFIRVQKEHLNNCGNFNAVLPYSFNYFQMPNLSQQNLNSKNVQVTNFQFSFQNCIDKKKEKYDNIRIKLQKQIDLLMLYLKNKMSQLKI